MSVTLAKVAGEAIWAAWGRPPKRHAEALELGSELAAGCAEAGYRFVKQEQIGWTHGNDMTVLALESGIAALVDDARPVWRDLP